MAYLLDANVFISAKNVHYGMDFCPAFWDWLDNENRSEKLYSIEKVYKELAATGDELANWAKERQKRFFPLPDDAEIESALTRVSKWIMDKGQYTREAMDEFMNSADFYLIAQALCGDHTVVTYEESARQSRKRIKIPDVCEGIGVKCISPSKLFRKEKARFVLDEDGIREAHPLRLVS